MTDTVRQAEVSQGEKYRVYKCLCFAVKSCGRVSDTESKRFVSSSRRLASSSWLHCEPVGPCRAP